MENRLEKKEFGIGNVFLGTLEICGQKYGQWLLIGLILMVVASLPMITSLVISIVIVDLQTIVSARYIVYAVALVSIYFTMRMTVVLYLSINDFIYYKETTINEQYKKSKTLVWKFFGAALVIAIMAFGVYLVYLLTSTILGLVTAIVSRLGAAFFWTLGITIAILVITLLWIIVKFYLALLVRVLNPEEISYLSYSKSLVKGSSFRVLFLYMIPTIVQGGLIALGFYMMLSGFIGMELYSGIIILTTLLLTPLCSCGFVVMYLLLQKKKGIPQEVEELPAEVPTA